MSNLVLGTVQFGLNYGINNQSGKPDDSQVGDILAYAYENGISELDTAQGYGDAESVIKRTLKAEKTFLIHSKFSLLESYQIGDIEDCLRISLKNIGVNKLGYFFFHRYSDLVHFSQTQKHSSIFIDKHSFGLAASIYSEEELRFALSCSFIKAVQIPFNIFDSSLEKLELIREACQKGVKIYCRSVFLQGLFFMNSAELPEKLKKFAPYLVNLEQVSKTYQVSKMSLALNFVKQFSEINGVLIGVDNKAQLEANMKAWKENCPLEALEKMRELTFPDKDLLMPKNW